MRKNHILMLMLAASLSASAQSPVKVNQIGYYPAGPKTAVIEPAAKAKSFTLKDSRGKTVWHGKAVRTSVSPFDGRQRQVVNFSDVRRPGTYTLIAKGKKQQVIIAPHAFKDVAAASVKAFYLQRTGVAIERKYAGDYARPAAHSDEQVRVHPSAASAGRPAGTIISSPDGWYDAGDYNKYIVNSGFTIGLILQSYQVNKEYFDQMEVNIPESGNGVADLLDEMMFNLRWMLTMQDPADGGVYHKLTTPNFEGFVMPATCQQPRYVVQKSTQAALDFAATMALAARIYSAYPLYQDFCRQALPAAERAYAWAVKNPTVLYDQPGNNEKYEPKIQTGMYDDKYTADEFFWAATELYLTTHEQGYLEQARQFLPQQFSLPTWGNVAGLGILQWLNQELLGTADAQAVDMTGIKAAMKQFCDADISRLPTSSFHSVFGNQAEDFVWGSNSEMCAGRGLVMMYQYALSKDKTYQLAALGTLDHLFGRNATGYCYVTGFGSQRVMHPHQRISAADGIEAPLPGFLAGGANSGKQDANQVPPYAESPDECYQDHVDSYASNEIAINWNAYLVSLLGWMR